MSPILTSLLLGLTAAAANVFGGAIIVQKHWERAYLRYFVALGAGFMLAVALVEMVPESIALRGPRGGFLILLGYLLVHFFEHTVTPHFHFGEETHADEFLHTHKSYSVLVGLLIHTFFDGIAIASGFSRDGGRRDDDGPFPSRGQFRPAAFSRRHDLRRRFRFDSRGQSRDGSADGSARLRRRSLHVRA
jgi:zinc transporter ZupT